MRSEIPAAIFNSMKFLAILTILCFVAPALSLARGVPAIEAEISLVDGIAVDKKGNITEVLAVKGIGAGCDVEAERVIRSSPKWKAGKQRGKAVKVRMILPITFKLG